MTDLPEVIRVGFRDFVVVPLDKMEDNNFGDCDVNRSVIRVCTTFDGFRVANTLIHEVLHAAWDSARLPGKESEERVVSHLADQLTQIWRDNPHLIEFMTQCVREAGN